MLLEEENMKGLRKYIIGVCACLMLLGGSMNVQAACGNWSLTGYTNPGYYCATPGCNSDRDLWRYIQVQYVRECIDDTGGRYKEYKWETKNDGCCP